MISILIATYNRSALLKRAIESVLKQDYTDYELVIVDDASTDDTCAMVRELMPERRDRNIRYVRNSVNVGATHGDLEIVRRFLQKDCRGEYFVYLCDDDYWLPDTLLTQQIRAFQRYPSLSFVQGGMVHVYPTPIPLIKPNEPYVTYKRAGDDCTLFWGTLYPHGYMPGDEFLRRYCEDPKNRNIVIGATMFKTTPFRKHGILDRCNGVRWQAGYAIIAGAALLGDAFYIDEPCLMTAVDINSASHRGTQKEHFIDCLRSMDAAFMEEPGHPYRELLGRSIVALYLCNKLGNRLGSFKANPLGDISHILADEITAADFRDAARAYGVELRDGQRRMIELSDAPRCDIERIEWATIMKMAKG